QSLAKVGHRWLLPDQRITICGGSRRKARKQSIYAQPLPQPPLAWPPKFFNSALERFAKSRVGVSLGPNQTSGGETWSKMIGISPTVCQQRTATNVRSTFASLRPRPPLPA